MRAKRRVSWISERMSRTVHLGLPVDLYDVTVQSRAASSIGLGLGAMTAAPQHLRRGFSCRAGIFRKIDSCFICGMFD